MLCSTPVPDYSNSGLVILKNVKITFIDNKIYVWLIWVILLNNNNKILRNIKIHNRSYIPSNALTA